MIRVKNIRAYRSNGPGYEECPRESGSRTRKWCLPGARTGRDRGPPCRSRRRSRSGARNCRRFPPRPRSSFPPRGSRRLHRGIASESMPFPREIFLEEESVPGRGRLPLYPLLPLESAGNQNLTGQKFSRENSLSLWKFYSPSATRLIVGRGRPSLLAGFRFGN